MRVEGEIDEFTAPCVRGRGLRSKIPQLGIIVSEASHPPFSLVGGRLKRTLPAHPLPLTMEKHLRQSY